MLPQTSGPVSTLSIEDDGLGVSEEALDTMLNLKPPPEGSLISRFGEGAKLAGVPLCSLSLLANDNGEGVRSGTADCMVLRRCAQSQQRPCQQECSPWHGCVWGGSAAKVQRPCVLSPACTSLITSRGCSHVLVIEEAVPGLLLRLAAGPEVRGRPGHRP